MATNPERREFIRFEHMSPVDLQGMESKEYHQAQMVNFSEGGMYLETNIAFQPLKDLSQKLREILDN